MTDHGYVTLTDFLSSVVSSHIKKRQGMGVILFTNFTDYQTQRCRLSQLRVQLLLFVSYAEETPWVYTPCAHVAVSEVTAQYDPKATLSTSLHGPSPLSVSGGIACNLVQQMRYIAKELSGLPHIVSVRNYDQ